MEKNANGPTTLASDILNKEEIMRQIKLAPTVKFNGYEIAFDLGEPDEIFLQIAEEELRETPEIVVQGLKELRELLAGEPDLRVVDEDDFYKMFLRPCKWYPKSALKLMKRHYRFHQAYPHIFLNLKPSIEKHAFCANLLYVSPLRSESGCRIFMLEVGKRWKPKEVSLDQLFKGMALLMKAALLEPKTQMVGIHAIIDMDGFSLSHVTYFTPSFAKMVVDFVQKCLPIRLKSINIINQSFVFNIVFAFFKPFLEEKIRKRIHVHGKNWDSLTAITGKSAVFTKYGGEIEYPKEPFGEEFWKYCCIFEDLVTAAEDIGYGPLKVKE